MYETDLETVQRALSEVEAVLLRLFEQGDPEAPGLISRLHKLEQGILRHLTALEKRATRSARPGRS
jgi:hypothetical protein